MIRVDCTARWKVDPPEKGNHYCSYERDHEDDFHMCICGATKDRKRRPKVSVQHKSAGGDDA